MHPRHRSACPPEPLTLLYPVACVCPHVRRPVFRCTCTQFTGTDDCRAPSPCVPPSARHTRSLWLLIFVLCISVSVFCGSPAVCGEEVWHAPACVTRSVSAPSLSVSVSGRGVGVGAGSGAGSGECGSVKVPSVPCGTHMSSVLVSISGHAASTSPGEFAKTCVLWFPSFSRRSPTRLCR